MELDERVAVPHRQGRLERNPCCRILARPGYPNEPFELDHINGRVQAIARWDRVQHMCADGPTEPTDGRMQGTWRQAECVLDQGRPHDVVAVYRQQRGQSTLRVALQVNAVATLVAHLQVAQQPYFEHSDASFPKWPTL